MSHTMVSIEALAAGWIAECLQCERRVVISHTALHEERFEQIETVLVAGDEKVSHSWSTRLDLRLGFAALGDSAAASQEGGET